MFIKLTAWKSDSKQGEPVYLNPLTITSIKADDTQITHVGTVDGLWFVMETPEEIMSQIESVAKYYSSLYKTLVF
jgi:hypothetical protein